MQEPRMIKSDQPSNQQQQQSQFLRYAPSNLEVPQEFIPNDFFIPTYLIAIGCGFFSISTVLFSIPALFFAHKSQMKKEQGIQFYREAKQFGKAALILDVVVLLWMLGWGIFLVTYAASIHYIYNGFEADDYGCNGDVHTETPFY